MRSVAFLAAFLAMANCGPRAETTSGDPAPAPVGPAVEAPVTFEESPELLGMKLTLTETHPKPEGAEALATPKATILDDAAIDALMSRVPPLIEAPTDRTPFALRPGSKPPPLSGSDVLTPFPPPPAGPPPAMTVGPLHVTRHMPDGEVPMAPQLTVSFDQPMVAITSQEEAAKTVPVTLDPQPAGRWRWLGTQTLLFDPDPRFPMATVYTVTIPAGTTSATGGKLATEEKFTFSTPAPVLQSTYPYDGPTKTQPVVLLTFDQAVDPAAIAAKVLLNAQKAYPTRLATDTEIAEDPTVKAMVAAAQPGRTVALIPAEPLPRATSFSVVVPKGSPSAEGPRTTTSDQYGGFYTYAPLAIEEHRCNWDPCPPNAGFYVRFNNPIATAFDTSTVTITPAVPGLSVQLYSGTMTFYGAFSGRTAYTVTIPGAIGDVFGQTLGKDAPLTFTVGPADKTLSGSGQDLVVLDPGAPAKLSVFSTNHKALKIKVQRVAPTDWAKWNKWLQTLWYEDATPGPLPGTNVGTFTVQVDANPDHQVETPIDLTSYLQDGSGQFVVFVEPTVQPRERWNRQYVYKWVEVTKIGLAAFTDQQDLVAWATDLGTGNSLSDVQLEVYPSNVHGASGADGLAKLGLPESSEGPQILIAKRGTDTAILPQNGSWYSDYAGWIRYTQLDDLRWYVFDDRGLYKPGEHARVKGWLRQVDGEKHGDVHALDHAASKVVWVLTSAMGDELGRGEADVSALGGFDLDLAIPKEANLGYANLQLTAIDAGSVTSTTTYHPLQIQEFRRPEFEVTSSSSEGPYVLGTSADVTVTAAYFAGGGLPQADVSWNAYAYQTSFVPPERSDYTFGAWTPWWGGWYPQAQQGTSAPPASLQTKTDASGASVVAVHFDSVNPARPMNVHVESTVFDVNRQAWTASSDLLVHPADRYVGLRTARSFVDPKDDIVVDAIVTDLDGKLEAGSDVKMRFARLEWGMEGGKWGEREKDPTDCSVASKADAVQCTFRPTVGGSWRVLASITDSHGRKNESELRIWVSGGDSIPARDVQQERADLIPDQQKHQPGDVAKVLVRAPFFPAEGLLTLTRSGIIETRRFRMDASTTTLEIPITEDQIPNLGVQVDLVGEAVRLDDDAKPRPDLPKRVAFATGAFQFEIPPVTRTLGVTVTPAAAKIQPGGDTSLDIAVVDAAGKPVAGAEVAVVVADESVLSLTGYTLPDPLAVFYAARPTGVSAVHLRSNVALTNPLGLPAADPNMPQGSAAPGMLGGIGYGEGGGATAAPTVPMEPMAEAVTLDDVTVAEKKANVSFHSSTRADRAPASGAPAPDAANQPPAIAMRTDFSALALFEPDVKTGADGHAKLPLHVPDSLTRYRIMVVAVAGGKQFGSGESAVTARLPLMVRQSPPRFLNFGDQFELPIVLQNQTDAPMTVDVGVRATNVTFTAGLSDVLPDAPDADYTQSGRRVTVPANDRVEVRFPAATVMAGTARFQAVATAGEASDASNFELPVWTPATTEAFATYGDVTASGAIQQPVEAPPGTFPQFGGLEVTTSSTQLQALTDAVLYLETYPYDCNEQIASRVLGIAALRDVLTAFESPDLPSPKAMESSVDGDLEHLAKRQNWDGGWAFWRKGDESWPYLTIHVAHALAMAKTKGYAVDDQMWNNSREYLRTIDNHIPSWYSIESRRFLHAYALLVRHRMGDTDVTEAKRLFKQTGTDGLPVDGLAFLLPVMYAGKDTVDVATIEHYLANNAAEEAGMAHFVTSYSDGAQVLLHSDRRADGVILDALLEVDPQNELIAKVARGLLAHKTKGAWANTQEDAFILLALDRYFAVYEKETPNFVARIWLGDGFAGDHAFRGRTTERVHTDIPMGYLTEHAGTQPLTIQKDGEGRLYYRIGLKYAPKDLDLEPADYGFAVVREYEAIDDPKDVTKDADGVWHVKAGASVRVRLTMATQSRRYHVALVDPLPAGLEVVNPELATSGTIPQDPGSLQQPYWWWWRTWYEHENLRDDRVEAFTSLLWEGVYEYTYIARATTPGRFVVPPTKAEEMYAPETFGRAGTDKLVVE
jgi:uncharacterized protein YfaS (alpha-2-macroglobulin family)